MKKIKSYEKYSITKEGRVFSGDKELKQHKSKNKSGTSGYMQVYLYDGKGGRKCKQVHRLVAEAFIPNPENKRTVNHIDGNKTNNNIDNLEWATDSENALHAHKNGLVKTKSGEEHHNSKPVEVYDKSGFFIDYCSCAREAERRGYGDYRNISAVCRGKRKTHNGFVFRFADSMDNSQKSTGQSAKKPAKSNSGW